MPSSCHFCPLTAIVSFLTASESHFWMAHNNLVSSDIFQLSQWKDQMHHFSPLQYGFLKKSLKSKVQVNLETLKLDSFTVEFFLSFFCLSSQRFSLRSIIFWWQIFSPWKRRIKEDFVWGTCLAFWPKISPTLM